MTIKLLTKFLPLILVMVFGSFFLFYELGQNALIEYDEGIYGLVAQNILKTGDFLTLHWRLDLPWFDKGPFYLWLTAVFLQVFGPKALAVRLGSAFLGLLTIVAVYFIGKKLYGQSIGLISALILASTSGFLYYARLGMLDVPNAAFNTLSLLFLIKSLERPKFLLVAAGTLGLGFLNRGPLAFFSFLSFLLYLLSEKKWKVFNFKTVLVAVGVFLLVVAPWHIAESLRHGNNFWEVYLSHQMFLRFSQTIEGKTAPFFWYLSVVKTQFRFWTLVLIPASAFLLIRFLKRDFKDGLILSWAVLTFGLFTLASSKLIWYILPVYPPLSLICGRFLGVLAVRLRRPRLMLATVFLAALFFNFNSWHRIQTVDFNKDLVSLLDYKNQMDPTAPILDVSYGVSVTSFYSLGPVSQIPKEELPGLLDGQKYRYALITRGDWEFLGKTTSLLNKNFEIVFAAGDGLIISLR